MKTHPGNAQPDIEEINRVQRDLFDHAVDFFDLPLEKGVPERLERIVAAAGIASGDRVLDVGAGTGVLVPWIRKYDPDAILACDLSGAMLARLRKHYPFVIALEGDVRDLTLPAGTIDVVLMNAVYSNIADKDGSFSNMSRMVKPGGRLVISHPMGKSFIDGLRKMAPFHLDDLPERQEAEGFLKPYGFRVTRFIDEPELYVLVALRRGRAKTGG